MKRLLLVLSLVCAAAVPAAAPAQTATAQGRAPVSLQAKTAAEKQLAGWQRQARSVTIVRDDWGIPHVHGKTDADAVFGLMYAQAEDDFPRIETNYLNAMGRLAEAEGESAIYRDLRMKLFVDPTQMRLIYDSSPQWLRVLMKAWADGLNYYLHTHPSVKPRVIRRFEPWMALTFTEGSIGGDVERISLSQLEAFYGKPAAPPAAGNPDGELEPGGSNGFAIAPANTADGHAMLWINPHTSFFFRAEAQVTSDEGLNAYGALTWGQFFVYQGFNEHVGWMHTSSGVDAVDEYAETIVRRGDAAYYRYGTEERPLRVVRIAVPYRTAAGMEKREFTVYRTHHGPIVREADGKWMSVRLMNEPLKALTQSYTRTKARDYKAFRATMELHTNSSNNTVVAAADGTIAYFHANFIPRRDARFDWSKPVDGSDPATEWNGLLSVDETPGVVNPASGWLYNTNNWPWTAAGPHSPKRSDYPRYVEQGEENPRGLHAIRVLSARKDFTLDSLIAAGYDSLLTEFERLIPPLLKAYDAAPADHPLKAKLAEPIAALRPWDYRWSVVSIPTSLAVFTGEDLWQRVSGAAREAGVSVYLYMEERATPEQRLQALAAACDRLAADFGTWKTPWGEINRFQRLTGDIVPTFDDKAPSVPVGFTWARWGSLASFAARAVPGTKKLYGVSGNSFVAAVQFGPRVRARAVVAGGQSGDPASPFFNDQAERYASGLLREVYFYRDQLEGHITRQYHPGEPEKPSSGVVSKSVRFY